MKKLKSEEDAFGHALLDACNGLEVNEIIERDDGFVTSTSNKVYFSNYEAWSPVEQKAMLFVKGRVLDIGCGAGRHSLHLQKRGFNVTGIDVSPLALKVCKERGLKKIKLMALENVHFTPESFDTILMMGNNFGLFGNFKKAKKLLTRFHRMTSKDGLIIASSNDPYKTDNAAHLQYHKMNKRKGRMSGQVKIRVRYQGYKGKWFDFLMVSKEEMTQILSNTGWKVSKFLDTGGSYYTAIIKKEPERHRRH
jgi:cyclopropane fatty-acyl-phospholipid synthase-like methyltransferase